MIAPWTEQLKSEPLRAQAAPRDLMDHPYAQGTRVTVNGLDQETDLDLCALDRTEWRILRRVIGHYPHLYKEWTRDTYCGPLVKTGKRVRDALGFYLVKELHGGLVVHVHESQVELWRAPDNA